jgi:hypothetical protein
VLWLDCRLSRAFTPSRPSSSLSSNTLLPPTSLLYLSSLYSLCRLYELHAAPRESQKKRKDTLQGSSALLCPVAMPRTYSLPCISFFLYCYTFPYIILFTPNPGNLFLSNKKVGDVLSSKRKGGAFASFVFSILLFLSKKESLHSHLLFCCLHARLLTAFSTFFLQLMLSTSLLGFKGHCASPLSFAIPALGAVEESINLDLGRRRI